MSSTGRSSRPSAGIAAASPTARIAASAGSAGSSGSSVVAFTEHRADVVELLPCGRPRRERLQHQLKRGSPERNLRALAGGHRLRLGRALGQPSGLAQQCVRPLPPIATSGGRDRKSTRLNSSHGYISYSVFCLKKKNTRNLHS